MWVLLTRLNDEKDLVNLALYKRMSRDSYNNNPVTKLNDAEGGMILVKEGIGMIRELMDKEVERQGVKK